MNAITTEMLSGVLDQLTALIPVVIPTVVGFIAIRKGLSFVLGSIKKA